MITTSKINKEYLDKLLLDGTSSDIPLLRSDPSGTYALSPGGITIWIDDFSEKYPMMHSKLIELNRLLMNREGIQIPNLGQDLWTFPITEDAMYIIIQSRLWINASFTYFNDYVPLINGYFVSGDKTVDQISTSRFILWRIPEYKNEVFNSTQRIGIRPIGEEYEILKYEIV